MRSCVGRLGRNLGGAGERPSEGERRRLTFRSGEAPGDAVGDGVPVAWDAAMVHIRRGVALFRRSGGRAELGLGGSRLVAPAQWRSRLTRCRHRWSLASGEPRGGEQLTLQGPPWRAWRLARLGLGLFRRSSPLPHELELCYHDRYR